ncbi:Alpha/Beta hydrolase protein [Chytridium lagenaria]|nr:Alpha/Beta hydrolase protein [Chytridium lagenaria]
MKVSVDPIIPPTTPLLLLLPFILLPLIPSTLALPSPTLYNASSPLFTHLLPYSLLSSTVYCNLTKNTWSQCQTCASLPFTPPTFIQVGGEPDDGVFEGWESGLRAGVTVNKGMKSAVVVFRGSKGVDNYILNANVWKTSAANTVRIHQGFLKAYKTLEPLIDVELQRVLAECSSCDTVVFTGHSLGGAMATIATYMYSTNGKIGNRKIRLFTFGSPRVATSALWKAVEATGRVVEVLRFVNGQDVVPSVPFSPSSTPFTKSYVHTPNLIYWPRGALQPVRCASTQKDGDGMGECKRDGVLGPLDHTRFGPFPQGRRVCRMNLAGVVKGVMGTGTGKGKGGKVKEKVDKVVESVGKKVKEKTAEVKKAIESSGKKVKEKTVEVKKTIESAAKKAQEKTVEVKKAIESTGKKVTGKLQKIFGSIFKDVFG